MEMKENSQKKMLLSVLGVAILVVAVIGISFAAYTATFGQGNANSVATGTIMVSYSEPTNAINITDALPLSDANGIALSGTGKTFDFTVSTHASGTLTVPYEISLTKVSGDLADGEVKVYLTKDGQAVLNPTLVSGLSAATYREGSKKLYDTKEVFTAPTGETQNQTRSTEYVLRMWLDSEVKVDATTSKEYHAKVNVDSKVTPVA